MTRWQVIFETKLSFYTDGVIYETQLSENKTNISLVVITLTAGVIYNFFLNIKIKSSSIWLLLTVVPRCHVDTCLWYPVKKGLFWNSKSKPYFNMTLFEGGSRRQTKNISFITWKLRWPAVTKIIVLAVRIFQSVKQ